MEIDQFIEQDILIFLDESIDTPPAAAPVATPTAYLVRDYEKDLQNSLSHNDVMAAKQVLSDLKEQFDEAPANTPDKEQMKALLMKLYEQFKNHLGQNHEALKKPAMPAAEPLQQSPSVKPEVTETSSKQIEATAPEIVPPKIETAIPETPKQKPATQSAFEMPAAPDPKKIAEEKLKAELEEKRRIAEEKRKELERQIAQKKEEERKRMEEQKRIEEQRKIEEQKRKSEEEKENALLEKIDKHIQKGNIKEAIESYRDAKQQITSSEGREKLHLTFESIKKEIDAKKELERKIAEKRKELEKKEEDIRKKEEMKKDAQANNGKPIPPSLDNDLLLQLEREKRGLDTSLQKNDLRGAIEQYKKMRIIVQQIQDKKISENAAEKLARIYTIIQSIKSHPLSDERTLMEATP